MQPGKTSTVVKPTLDTQFHIDFDWWQRENNDLRAYMLTHLPADMRPPFEGREEFEVIDYIDPKTGEVHQYNELELAIREASKRDDFITLQTSLVDSIFRVFLANGNAPSTPKELEAQTGRDARTILKTFGGLQVYRGIRPVQNS
jgi:hypothetical protein